tara:strand:+ start:241 stop:549 length:309 start_codon:yes stop_codon:yes gene_type:complete
MEMLAVTLFFHQLPRQEVVVAVTEMDRQEALAVGQGGQADRIVAVLELLGKVMLAVIILRVVVLTAHTAALAVVVLVVLAHHQEAEIELEVLVRHLQLQGRQ